MLRDLLWREAKSWLRYPAFIASLLLALLTVAAVLSLFTSERSLAIRIPWFIASPFLAYAAFRLFRWALRGPGELPTDE